MSARPSRAVSSFLALASLGASDLAWSAPFVYGTPLTAQHSQSVALTDGTGAIHLIGGGLSGSTSTDHLILNASGSAWATGPALPVPTRGAAGAVGSDGKLYVLGGYASGWIGNTQIFDPNTNTWSSGANLPTPCWEARAESGLDGRIYVIGGENAPTLVQIYTPSTNAWSTGTPMPASRHQHGVARGSDGRIYVFGGMATGLQTDIYTPSTNTWTVGPSMPSHVSTFGYGVSSDRTKIIVAGGSSSGSNGGSPYYNVTYQFDVPTQTWSTLTASPLLTARRESAGAVNAQGLHIIGGNNGTDILSQEVMALACGDSDGDGFTSQVCGGTDCNDGSSAVHPGASELCSTLGVDDDCDASIDEADASDATTWYADADADAFGDSLSSQTSCVRPANTSATGGDCNDFDADIGPAATEIPYDTIDNDCVGGDACDVDEDLGIAEECGGDDCDDADPLAYTGADEIWYDGIDEACDGGDDNDRDGDGFVSADHGGDDCDDAVATTYPGADDEPYDGLIEDCDASDENDADGDGVDSADHGGADCDDAASDVFPGASEVTGDGVDQDCSGGDRCLEDADADGQAGDAGGTTESDDADCTDPGELPVNGAATDCDDSDPESFAGALEVCGDAIDQNCDGDDVTCPVPVKGCGCDGSPTATWGAWMGVIALLGLGRRNARR